MREGARGACVGSAGTCTIRCPSLCARRYHRILDAIILWIFILEIVIKLIAEGNKPLNFFTDGWNVFDFLIVAVGLMPFGGNAITALRLVRLLRVLKLVRPRRDATPAV